MKKSKKWIGLPQSICVFIATFTDSTDFHFKHVVAVGMRIGMGFKRPNGNCHDMVTLYPIVVILYCNFDSHDSIDILGITNYC